MLYLTRPPASYDDDNDDVMTVQTSFKVIWLMSQNAQYL